MKSIFHADLARMRLKNIVLDFLISCFRFLVAIFVVPLELLSLYFG